MKIRHCENCGADLGTVEDKWPGDPMVTCRSLECKREATYQIQAEEADARDRAEADGYDRYR